jgi:UDP-N-acetylglucosamine--N-acetylmuramyl-(pentapeptide) pyrophosphoryl-undecaprenol N-acetylglucosamine transferase
MAAGTGGHIIPGLAVAREMLGRGWTVSWLGTRAGMENQLVPKSGIALDTIGFSGLRGRGLLHTATGGLRLLKAFWDALRVLRRRGADAVLGMGGYVCFPGGLMASLLNTPLMLVNADAALLLSNKALLPVADRVAFGFEGEAAAQTKNAVVTGNPVRAEIEALPEPAQRWAGRSGPLRLLVVGGSLGAQVLNQTVPAALALLPNGARPHVVHQTGGLQADEVRAAYVAAGYAVDGMDGVVGAAGMDGVDGVDLADGGGVAEVLPFIDDMAQRLAACDLMLCRAGAITVSELCAAGVPALLVPLVISTTAHQRDNAAWMAGQGAALHLPQAGLTPQALADTLAGLTRDGLLAMASKARTLARPRAAARVADELEQLLARFVRQRGRA